MQVFLFMLEKMFGEDAGFKQRLYKANKEEIRLDIIECPYCEYCKLCNCPELIHTFCDSDIYCYGNLPKIEFVRHSTLGTGGEKCDFYFKRRR